MIDRSAVVLTNESTFTSTTTSITARWLSPVEALGRFSTRGRVQIEAEGESNEVKRYGFRIGELGLLIEPGVACEVVPPSAIARIPNTTDWLSGFTNLRGSLVPVFDLARLFGIGEGVAGDSGRHREKKMVLVVGKGDRAAGLLIDGFPIPVSTATVLRELPPLPESLAPHVSSGHLHDGAAWIEFHHVEFFEALAQRIAA